MKIIKYLIIIFTLFNLSFAFADTETFEDWLKSFKKKALLNNISEETFSKTMSKVKYLPKVIKYDRYQPEFYEDTISYISKRTSEKKTIKRFRTL